MVEFTDDLGKELLRAIENVIDQRTRVIIEEEAKAAGDRAVARVKEMAVEIATKMRAKLDMNFYNSREIHIAVHFSEGVHPIANRDPWGNK